MQESIVERINVIVDNIILYIYMYAGVETDVAIQNNTNNWHCFDDLPKEEQNEAYREIFKKVHERTRVCL